MDFICNHNYPNLIRKVSGKEKEMKLLIYGVIYGIMILGFVGLIILVASKAADRDFKQQNKRGR